MDYENMYFSKVENIVMIDYEGVARIFQMSQTVPTGNCYIPDPYAAYADSFDLSLLPSSSSSSVTASVTTATTNDCEVPLSPQSELSSIILPSSESLISTSSQSQLVSLDYIPTTIYNDQQIKIEKPWNQEDTNNNNNNNNTNNYNNNSRTNTPTIINTVEIAQQTITDTSILLQQLQKQYQFYPSPLPSPPQDFSLSSPVPSITSTGIYPPSPCSTIEPSYQNFQIKQEYHILPPSPPESNGAPSPACIDIKCEPDTDTEQLIDIDSLLEKSLQSSQSLSSPQSPLSPLQSSNQSSSSSSSQQNHQQQQNIKKPVQDHQLLREYLQDTSFQKKHNLKPLALESLIGGLGVRGDIEPVISLALEYAKRDAQATCAILKISPDPQQWTTSQVHAWIRSTIEQFKLPQIDNVEIKFPEDGSALICLTEEEFQRRIPEAGSTIHAQLEIWKLACSENFQTTISSSTSIIDLTTQIGPSTSTTNWNSNNCSQNMDISDDENEEMIPTSATKASAIPQPPPPPPPLSTSSSSSSSSPLSTSAIVTGSAATTIENGITGTSTVTVTSSSKNTTGTTTGTGNITKSGPGTRPGSSHIHLWQFLKELLSTPQINGTAIRWLDRNKGVFKIEDSVRVAKLWGRRKNRPAMNYDKLSRSIRQYYKKGIMKKTERSQRLVYQFCHPYCL